VDPLPKDGMQGWNRYLSLTLRYPIRSRQNNSEGVVFIAFDLNENGEIKNPEVANPEEMDPLLAEEALRALRIYPYKWTPLTIDGVAKRCKRRLPVNFKLTD
jgi:TonB family protein